MDNVRLATEADAHALSAIYAPNITLAATSFEAEVPDAAEMTRRLTAVLTEAPWLVLERDGAVAGYAYAGRHRARAAYYGEEVMRLQRGRHEVKLMVRYPRDQRRSLADFENLPRIPIEHPQQPNRGEVFLPYLRNERLSRPWAPDSIPICPPPRRPW